MSYNPTEIPFDIIAEWADEREVIDAVEIALQLTRKFITSVDWQAMPTELLIETSRLLGTREVL